MTQIGIVLQKAVSSAIFLPYNESNQHIGD
jgi:hypothetical protein